VYIALGITVHGTKVVLGLWIEHNEGAKYWLKVVSELKTRGVRDLLVVCCDGRLQASGRGRTQRYARRVEPGSAEARARLLTSHDLRRLRELFGA
jgi:hypothetical protein